MKNEGNLLPLDITKLQSVAVIGPNADCVQFGDYTWSKNKEDGITPLQGIYRLAGKKVKVNYAQGCSIARWINQALKKLYVRLNRVMLHYCLLAVQAPLLYATVVPLLLVERELI